MKKLALAVAIALPLLGLLACPETPPDGGSDAGDGDDGDGDGDTGDGDGDGDVGDGDGDGDAGETCQAGDEEIDCPTISAFIVGQCCPYNGQVCSACAQPGPGCPTITCVDNHWENTIFGGPDGGLPDGGDGDGDGGDLDAGDTDAGDAGTGDDAGE